MPKFKEARPHLTRNKLVITQFCFKVKLKMNGEGDPEVRDGWYVHVKLKKTGEYWAGRAVVKNYEEGNYRRVFVNLSYVGVAASFNKADVDPAVDPEDVTILVGEESPPTTYVGDTDVVVDFP